MSDTSKEYDMAIDLEKNICKNGKHDFAPIIEGGQTVGLTCLFCGKSVREAMEYSDVVVLDNGAITGITFMNGTTMHRRKDGRF